MPKRDTEVFLKTGNIWTISVAQLLECLPLIHKAPGSIPSADKTGHLGR